MPNLIRLQSYRGLPCTVLQHSGYPTEGTLHTNVHILFKNRYFFIHVCSREKHKDVVGYTGNCNIVTGDLIIQYIKRLHKTAKLHFFLSCTEANELNVQGIVSVDIVFLLRFFF